MFVLTTAVAAYFSLACSRGYVDATIVLAAVAFLVRVMRRPRRVHSATGVILMTVTATLLWANLRQDRSLMALFPQDIKNVDSVTRIMFFRGWPLCPCLFALGNLSVLDGSGCGLALLVDAAVFAIAIVGTKALFEWCFANNDEMNRVDSRRWIGLRWRSAITWCIAVTILVEAITAHLRFYNSTTAVEFNQTAPLLLQIHHMFWSIPLLAVVPFVWRRPRLSGALLGIACGLIASDLMHHFVVLPLTVGNTGWHWP